MRILLTSLALLGVLTQPCDAQCTVTSVQATQYGQGCNTVFGIVPDLSGVFDPTTCTIQLTLTGFPGCCNTFLRERILIVGAQPANVPLPFIGPGCTLLATLDVVVSFPTSAGNVFTLPLPLGLPATRLFAQGGNLYFTTIGMTLDLELSQGLQISIR
jgi:hypothetical protein